MIAKPSDEMVQETQDSSIFAAKCSLGNPHENRTNTGDEKWVASGLQYEGNCREGVGVARGTALLGRLPSSVQARGNQKERKALHTRHHTFT